MNTLRIAAAAIVIVIVIAIAIFVHRRYGIEIVEDVLIIVGV